MSSPKPSNNSVPSDLLTLAALALFMSALYTILIKPSYLVASGWLVSSMLFYLRSRQLAPIQNRIVRLIFWLIALGVLAAIWWLTVR